MTPFKAAALAPLYPKGRSVGPEGWANCFATLAEPEPNNAPDVWAWEDESCNDPYSKTHPEGEAKISRTAGAG